MYIQHTGGSAHFRLAKRDLITDEIQRPRVVSSSVRTRYAGKVAIAGASSLVRRFGISLSLDSRPLHTEWEEASPVGHWLLTMSGSRPYINRILAGLY